MTVGVIGAGMSGLSVTHFLADRGVDVKTFEAAEQPGGIVRSRTAWGRVLEVGPQRLRLSRPVKSLVSDLGIDGQLVEGNDDQPLYAYYDGDLRAMPLSVREAITTDLLSWRGKARVIMEPFTGPARPGETVEAFLTRKFGAEASSRFMGPLYSGLYGTDPDDMFVEYSLGRALEHVGIDGSILVFALKKLIEGADTPPIVSFEDGLQTLPWAMYEQNKDAIALETPVESVQRVDGGFEIQTDGDDHRVETVVFSTPAPTTARLLEDIDDTTSARLQEFRYNPIGVVHLYSEFDGAGHGFHVIDDGYKTGGSTWNHSMLGRDGVYTSYVGSTDRSFLEADRGVIGRRGATEFETITGADCEVLDVSVIRPGMPAYDRSWSAIEKLSLPPGVKICSSFLNRAGIVGRIRNGRRTAEEIAGE